MSLEKRDDAVKYEELEQGIDISSFRPKFQGRKKKDVEMNEYKSEVKEIQISLDDS